MREAKQIDFSGQNIFTEALAASWIFFNCLA